MQNAYRATSLGRIATTSRSRCRGLFINISYELYVAPVVSPARERDLVDRTPHKSSRATRREMKVHRCSNANLIDNSYSDPPTLHICVIGYSHCGRDRSVYLCVIYTVLSHMLIRYRHTMTREISNFPKRKLTPDNGSDIKVPVHLFLCKLN